MKILRVISTLDPAYGGPVEGLRSQTASLARLGHETEVVTLDAESDPRITDLAAKVHVLGPSYGGKYRFNPRLLPWLEANNQRFDCVIVHGIWQYHSFCTWLAYRRKKTPYFVYTHGALDPWFKVTYPLKHLKKWLYWPWAEYRVLKDASAVLFTSEEERLLAAHSFWLYRAREKVVPYGIEAAPGDLDVAREHFYRQYPEYRGKRYLLFLSRIHPKKGCDLLIEAFARVTAQFPDLYLVMAGPDQIGWSEDLQRQARSLGIGNRVLWPGMLTGEIKWGAYHAAEAFILPSHSENFGIVVAEALACGCPVIITNQVNIWREINAARAGLVCADEADSLQHTLIQFMVLSPEERQEMSQNARHCFQTRFDIDLVSEQLIEQIKMVAP
jgi:glycosyltransferase involved in cell wall biosynthesis